MGHSSTSFLLDFLKHPYERHGFTSAFFWRSWRDLNSRAGNPTYTLSRGAPSANLGTTPCYNRIKEISNLAERIGFEPTVPFDITGFQDQLHKPLGHLSKQALPPSIFQCLFIISEKKCFVKIKLPVCRKKQLPGVNIFRFGRMFLRKICF